MLKHLCVLSAACIFLACSQSEVEKKSEDGAIKLFLGKLEVPMFDSISVRISALDMNDIHISESDIKDNLKINGIPYGENREFEVKIYADSGKLVQIGSASADLIAGETPTIPITLTPLMGFLKLEIPLGIPNNTDIHSGKLFIENLGLEYKMIFETGKGVFYTNSLDLYEPIEIRVELYDSNGDILFSGERELSISSILQKEIIQLQSTKGSVILELQASSDGPSQILAMLPESAYGKSRTPKNFGDLFFTEIYADPAEGDNFQYIELYNPTLDTLQLSSCRIARQIETQSGGTGRHNISRNLILPPVSYIILGRSSVLSADYNGNFSLLKGGQSIGFFCDNFTVDTLTYSKSEDNAFPLAKGRAMQLPLANYQSRTQGESWCFGFSPKADAICQ